jgi:hypothetical protein
MNVTRVAVPPPERVPPRMVVDPDYFQDAPAELLDPNSPGRAAPTLRQTAQLRDGNAILQSVARQVASNFLGLGPPVSQDMLTAMTQLAVTGSNAFAAWFANPVCGQRQSTDHVRFQRGP